MKHPATSLAEAARFGRNRIRTPRIGAVIAAAFLSATLWGSTVSAQDEAEDPNDPEKPSGWSTPTLPAHPRKAAALWDMAGATVVIYNATVPESADLARFYAEKREIPESNIIGLDCAASETITREEFERTIRDPLLRVISERVFWKVTTSVASGKRSVSERKIHVLAPVFGIPVRIERTAGKDGKPKGAAAGKGDEAAVDSELALLGAFDTQIDGPLKNPYFQKDTSFPSLDSGAMFLVGRLDGPSPEVVQRMITDAMAAEKTGLRGFAYFDMAKKGTGYEAGDQWIAGSEKTLRAYGFPTVVDPYSDRIPSFYPMEDAAFYFGWYTGHLDGPFLSPEFEFVPGAVACHLHSFSAQELRQSTRHWTGPLLRRRAAASLGNVWEPYLALTVHFDILTDRLLGGYSFAEASWMATPALSWMNIAVGDPLYRPFKSHIVGPPIGEKPDGESDIELFQRLAINRTDDTEADRKRSLVDAAMDRKSGLLLEGAGLISAASSRHAEAIDLFEHAAATYLTDPGRIRSLLHVADMHRRSGNIPAAKSTLEKIVAAFPDAPAARAAKEFLNRLSRK